MKIYRVSGLIMIIITAIISMATVDLAAKTQRAAVAAKHKPIFHRAKITRFIKAKRRHRLVVDNNTVTENAEQHKPLDLAVHFKDLQEHDARSQINGIQQNSESSLFENRKKQDALQVKGQFVMSQDPEADKRKSADGAGITINLRR